MIFTRRQFYRVAPVVVALLGLMAAETTQGQLLRGRRDDKFPVEKDVQIGQLTVQQIEADPKEYPILPESDYPEAYGHLRRIVGGLLESPAIQYRELFRYDEIKIIHDDKTLNAFVTAGGFIYVYTGLIKYLDAEDHLAGVLGHEIAHAERRHVVTQMQRDIGRRRLILMAALVARPDLSAGDVALLASAKKLLGLRYSREQEAEADAFSVVYLSTGSSYQCNGAAGFFRKILEEGGGKEPPKWLSSHPDSESRVHDIEAKAGSLGCDTTLVDPDSYRDLAACLP